MSPDDIALLEFTEPHWFRVEAEHDEYQSRLVVIPIPILKYTPKGVWVSYRARYSFKSGKRLILRNYVHRGRAYAAPTEKQARDDFRKRKEFQIRMLKAELANAQKCFDLVNEDSPLFS
jgi:hypothetical protein